MGIENRQRMVGQRTRSPTVEGCGRRLCRLSFVLTKNKSILVVAMEDECGTISALDMSGEMHMGERSRVFGCIPHGRGA